MGTALANAAVGDDFVLSGDALTLVKPLQIVERLEGAVFVGGLRPRDVGRLRDMARALGCFSHARRRDNLTGELVHGTNVNQLGGSAALKDGEDIFLEGANGRVRGRNPVRGGGGIKGVLGERPLFLEPLPSPRVS